MIGSLQNRYFLLTLILGAFFMMGSVLPDSKYKTPVGGSQWRVGKTSILANVVLNENLFSDIRGMKEKHGNFATCSNEELKHILTEFIQPYVNKKISVSVNGKIFPVQACKLTRTDDSKYIIGLSINEIAFDRADNDLKIEYRMLFDELGKNHLNLAYLYRSDASGDALQKLLDNTPAEGRHDFTPETPTWELSIKGPAGVASRTVDHHKGVLDSPSAPLFNFSDVWCQII